MIQNEPWLRFAYEIRTEYEQCRMEGLDVERFEKSVEQIEKKVASVYAGTSFDADLEREAWELACEMHKSPKLEGFDFVEPSTLEEIEKESPNRIPDGNPAFDDAFLQDRFRGAWIGRIGGCLLGKPVEGWRREDSWEMMKDCKNFPLNRYIRLADMSPAMLKQAQTPGNFRCNPCYADFATDGMSPSDDDTNYTVFAMRLLDTYGQSFSSDDVLSSWMRWIPMLNTCTAERVAYRNGAIGIAPPGSASFRNPYREWIGAQIRGDYFGYVNLGRPHAAARMAFRDAAISHVKNGIYGEMFCAALMAGAVLTDDMKKLLSIGLDVIPARSRLNRDIRLVLEWYEAGLSYEEVLDRIVEMYPPYARNGWVYTNPNTMIVATALLYSRGEFGPAVCRAVQAAYDTDCNGATVGSVVGILNGADRIDPQWTEPFPNGLHTQIDGYQIVTVDQLASKTKAHYLKIYGKLN